MALDYEVKDFTAKTWPDFIALFGKHRGVRGGCWCTSHRCSSSRYNQMSRDERQSLQHELVLKGQGYGLLVYDEGQPIAWCQFGPATGLASFDNGRKYKKLDIPREWRPAWRISCLFVDKDRRREGWSTVALQEALSSIGNNGGGVVEAFPFDIPDRKRPSYTGSLKMYLQHGFTKVAEIGKNRYLVRRCVN